MLTAKNSSSGTEKVKSSFAMTCNRLSLFLKDKGSLKDIGVNATFDVKGEPESLFQETETNKTTVDLLSKMESPVNMSRETEKYINVDSLIYADKATESKTAQMTILYGGQVLVFDCISADKAREIMLVADASSSEDNNQIQYRIPVASTSNSLSEGFGLRYRILPGLQIKGSDLPIARRSSLHKFLSKRKERATERAPYQLPNRLD